MSETESAAGLRERPVEPELVIDLTDAGRARAGAGSDVLELPVDRLEVVAEPRTPRRLPGTAMLVGSSGGHLAQLQTVAPLWDVEHRSYVTFDTDDALSLLTGEQVTWAHHPTTRNLRNLVRNSALAVRELRRRRPDVVVSTGAAVAFPFFLAARAMRIPTVYVEVYDRIDSPTLTGRLCRPLTTLFCVQWPEQTAFYKKSQLVGSLM
jgi:UDP-N-acetylglucosamine:LPS N-acetylglucosamine transferase